MLVEKLSVRQKKKKQRETTKLKQAHFEILGLLPREEIKESKLLGKLAVSK